MIVLDIIPNPDEDISIEIFEDPLITIGEAAPTEEFSLEMASSSPLTMDIVTGGIVGDPGPRGLKGDKGDKGDPGDPGSLDRPFTIAIAVALS